MKVFVSPRWFVFLFALVASGSPPNGLVWAESFRGTFTFPQAVERVLAVSPGVQITAEAEKGAQARVRAASAQRFPVLRAEGNILRWDQALDIRFAPPPMPGMEPAPGAESSPALRVRDQVTWQTSVTLAQPISGLFVLHRLVRLERSGVEAASADLKVARLDAAQGVAESYLRVLAAAAQVEVAGKAVAQLEAQLARAAAMERAGALAPVDLLRLTSARDNARQGALRAQTAAAVSRAALVLALDLPSGTPIEVVDDFPDPPAPLILDDRQAAERALEARPELAAAASRHAQAAAGRSVAKAAFLPNVMGIVSYQHTEGQAAFQPKDAWYVGATLSWDLWDWGKTANNVREAGARARQAELAAQAARDQVVFDARRRLLEARSAYEMLAVARSSLQAAEEAYRIQSVRFAEGAATTTDVIDAETDVSRARAGYAQARFDYYLAQAAVARALGELPMTRMGGTHANP